MSNYFNINSRHTTKLSDNMALVSVITVKYCTSFIHIHAQVLPLNVESCRVVGFGVGELKTDEPTAAGIDPERLTSVGCLLPGLPSDRLHSVCNDCCR